MKLCTLVAQFPISLSIQQNLETILSFLEHAQPGDLVLFPEGAISGYSHDLTFLNKINQQKLGAALQQLQHIAEEREIYLWVGSLIAEGARWFNRAYGFDAQGKVHTYDKINLAHHERGILTPGNDLPVFDLSTPHGGLKIGVQLCREIRYPEQWGGLAREGAQIILHLNNAINNPNRNTVWRSHLVSRAAETQRFVLSANNAAMNQLSPTMVIAPNGEILAEIASPEQNHLHLELDLSLVSDWYLRQCRDDVVEIVPKN